MDYSTYPCETGHYCPPGTEYAQQFPCDIGHYNPNETQSSSSACLACPPGKYCGFRGQAGVSGDCLPGYFCTGASAEIAPYVVGKYNYTHDC